MHGDSYDFAPVLHDDMSVDVAAALKGDEISRHALLELNKVMLDYPEPESVDVAAALQGVEISRHALLVLP